MKSKLYLKIGLLFILTGALLGTVPFTQYWHNRDNSTAHAAPVSQAITNMPAVRIEGKPTHLTIPSLNIDLNVADGIYYSRTKTWSLSLDKAHYALMTPFPNNQMGNTFIYGHNRREVFNRLPKIQPGSSLTLTTDNGHVFTYKFRNSYETNPNDDRLFNYQGPPILTLQTCSGLWYQNRQLFTFDFVEVH